MGLVDKFKEFFINNGYVDGADEVVDKINKGLKYPIHRVFKYKTFDIEVNKYHPQIGFKVYIRLNRKDIEKIKCNSVEDGKEKAKKFINDMLSGGEYIGLSLMYYSSDICFPDTKEPFFIIPKSNNVTHDFFNCNAIKFYDIVQDKEFMIDRKNIKGVIFTEL